MDRTIIKKASSFRGEFTPPPDKSISHRAVFFCSISKGRSIVRNFLSAHDPLSSANAFRSLGIEISHENNDLFVTGKGLHGLGEPADVIDCGNSGTTMRLLIGLLSGNPFYSVLTGDGSLRGRPMARVIKPCTKMGALIYARDNDNLPPVTIRGGDLKPISYVMPVASAQVKSALILAGLYAEGLTEIEEPAVSRDHSERMLPAFGADIRVVNKTITVGGLPDLEARDVEVPGDFSSAAFFIAAALLVKGGKLTIKDCGINPTRTGLIEVIKKMGGNISTENHRTVSGEPIADILCGYSPDLKAVTISGEEIPLLIDEFPVITLLATQAEGVTEIRGAEELRVKESDRIRTMAHNLRSLGAEIEEYGDGLDIKGKSPLKGTLVGSFGDHRIGMTMAVAGLIAEGETGIEGTSSVRISFPDFFKTLGMLCN